MRSVMIFALTMILLALSGCSTAEQTGVRNSGSSDQRAGADALASGTTSETNEGAAARSESNAQPRPASLVQGENNPAPPPSVSSVQRRVIRRGEFTIETETPADGARRIGQIAEARGGYVVTSGSQQTGDDQARPSTTASITVRVPAEQFAAAIEDLRGAGGRIQRESVTGQDVTEEYTDLEARIRAKRALEDQFIEIMRQARTIADTLQVQQQLGQVRAEIEQMEGRRRLLENQSALSTIVVTLQSPGALVNTSGFFYNLREALSDGIEFASAILFGLIRLALALLPVALFIVLPIVLLARFLIQRAHRQRLGAELRNDDLRREAQAEHKSA